MYRDEVVEGKHMDKTYLVVLNDEEQYSIWPADRDLPAGWRGEGFSGPEAVCLAHIEEIWTDMRPLSLRRAMAQTAGSSGNARMTNGATDPSDHQPGERA